MNIFGQQRRLGNVLNPSTAKGGGVKLPPRAHFCNLLRHLDQQPKFLRWLFLNMFSAQNDANFDFLWLRVMTPWRVKVTSFFWKKWKLAFTHLHDGNYGNMNETWLVSLEQRSTMMTWLDSWQYVITWHTWHTWHDVKAWLHEHKVLYLTSSICRCEWTEAMILLLFHTVSMSWNSLQLSSFAWPQRVTLKPKVTSWSTWLLLSLLVFVLPHWIFFVS